MLLVPVLTLKHDLAYGKIIRSRHCLGSRFNFVGTSDGTMKNRTDLKLLKIVT